MLPDALLPATTALGTLDGRGRQEGVLSGCNVVMPNLSPMAVRKKYLLYDHKAGTEDSGESSLSKLRAQMQEIGYTVAVGRGDFTGGRDRIMIKIAVYGKGGIGKSTTVSNLAAALSEKGLRVMQIGCDPKADSTTLLTHGAKMQTALGLMRERNNDFALSDMAKEGFGGVICVEAGGPTPGLGCAGRGIIAALEKLEEKGAYETFRPDVVFYDVLGDVVCGGFSMPMRAGYADRVFIVTSGENMALHAAANIAMAVENFRGRGYATLGGLILNRRNVKNEEEKVRELAGDISSQIVGSLDFSETVQQAEALSKTVIEAFPESEMAAEYRALADAVLRACEVAPC